MSRQYFQDLIQEPLLADILTYSTVTTEALLWPIAIATPIPANDMRPGKAYRLTAGGIITLPAATGSITLTPRIGVSTTVATNVSLGASGAQFSSGATTNRPWYMEFTVLCRAQAVTAGASDTCIGWGFWTTQGVLTTGGANMMLTLGGTSAATIDFGVQQGIGVSIIWGTTAGSITTQGAFIQSLN